MIVRCLANQRESLPEEYLGPDYNPPSPLPLTIGKDYVVFGVTGWHGGIWYYVADDYQLDWPIWYPAVLFKVVDGRIPSDWRFAQQGEGANSAVYLTFPEWADDWYFYDRLTDGNRKEVHIYREYRKRLEQGLG
jgi:hypothetical protein